jgi:rod shape-determining protein MreC
VDTFLSRYRNLTVLMALLLAQLLLLAFQVRTGQDVRLLRVWAVTAVTPVARAVEWARGGANGVLSDYILLRDFREENQRLKEELGRLKLETQALRADLSSAGRAQALQIFQQKSASRTLAARVLATGTGSNSRAVYIDLGSANGVKRGMAVITPEGIVGKVVASYPTASLVMLVTSQGFAAGVVSQQHHIRGTLRGQGSDVVTVDYIQNEAPVAADEWFYTTGDDRIFPKGMPVGKVRSAKAGRGGQEIVLEPSGMAGGLEEVLVVIAGVHGEIPEPDAPASGEYSLLPAPSGEEGAAQQRTPGLVTDADKIEERYRRLGEAQNHVYGETAGRAPDFNKPLPTPTPTPTPAPTTPPPPAATAATGTPAAAPVKKQ